MGAQQLDGGGIGVKHAAIPGNDNGGIRQNIKSRRQRRGRNLPIARTGTARRDEQPRALNPTTNLPALTEHAAVHRLRAVAGPFAWAPQAVAHFRPRSSWTAFYKQYYRYARGDGKADLWRRRHAVRYATYLIALPTLLTYALGGRQARALGWLGLLLGFAAYNRRPWQRLRAAWEPLTWAQRLLTLGLAPLIRVVGDVAKMTGYPVGVWWRWRRAR